MQVNQIPLQEEANAPHENNYTACREVWKEMQRHFAVPDGFGKIREKSGKKYPRTGYFEVLPNIRKYRKSLLLMVPRKGLEPPQCCHH
jgi:hypothetical protein